MAAKERPYNPIQGVSKAVSALVQPPKGHDTPIPTRKRKEPSTKITFYLPTGLARALKVAAAHEGIDASTKCRELLEKAGLKPI